MIDLIERRAAIDAIEDDIAKNGEPIDGDYNIGMARAAMIISTIQPARVVRKFRTVKDRALRGKNGGIVIVGLMFMLATTLAILTGFILFEVALCIYDALEEKEGKG